jgi:hypothetical protein
MDCESGVSYAHVRDLLPLLVELGVLEKLKPRAGTRPAVYRFTLRDPAGLPRWLPSAPASSALSEASLVRQDPALVRQNPAASAPLSGAKPDEPENHRGTGGSSGSGESSAPAPSQGSGALAQGGDRHRFEDGQPHPYDPPDDCRYCGTGRYEAKP